LELKLLATVTSLGFVFVFDIAGFLRLGDEFLSELELANDSNPAASLMAVIQESTLSSSIH